MSEDKKIQNLIINKLTKEQYKSLEEKAIDELYFVTDEEHFTAEEINELLAVKQDKLTAGDGIEILEDGTINNTRVSAEWGNIQGDLSAQTDLQELVSTKVDKQEGKSLISNTEIERLANVDNYDDTLVLSNINDLKINKQDKLTAGTGIEISEDNVISATGTQGGSSTWGSIDGDIKSQEDLQDELNTRGSKLEYTGSTLSLLNSNDEVLNSVNITSGGTTVEVDIATVDKAGIVKPDGDTISVDDNGTISANIPDVDTSNLANIDLSNITDLGLQNILSTLANVAKTGSYNDLIDVPEQYSLPVASTVELGGVKIDGDTINIDESGIISVGNLDNKANVSLSNLDAIGEAKISSVLNNNITNCLLEVPQRIKYDLTDGTLTIKAGTVVIVPYGTEDLSSTYPVGATFIRDWFKVYNTQFTDGKFFVWAELTENQIVPITTSGGGFTGAPLSFNFSANIESSVFGWSNKQASGTETGTVASTLYYQIDNNTYLWQNAGTEYMSLPILQISHTANSGIVTIDQVFNGMGYIGSTVWLDKGITAICGQGYNIDGTIKNATHKNSGIELIDMSGWDAITTYNAGYLMYVVSSSRNSFWFQPYSRFYTSIDPITTDSICYSYVDKERQWYVWDSASNKPYWEKAQVYIFAEMTTKDNKAFNPKLPFRAVDVQDIDGQWVAKSLTLTGTTVFSNTDETSYSLANYLPNDGGLYEVKFYVAGNASKTAQYNYTMGFCWEQLLFVSGNNFASNIIGLANNTRKLRITPTTLCSGTTKASITLRAYRKVR